MLHRRSLLSTGMAGFLSGLFAPLATPDLPASVSSSIDAVMPDVVAWRRDLHEHPELSNQEFRTAALVAKQVTLPFSGAVEAGSGPS